VAVISAIATSTIVLWSSSSYVRTSKEQYGEEIIANALDSEDRHIEFFRNPKTKSWTIIITVAENVSCVIGAGHQMEVPNIDGKKCAGLVNAI
tara:strand:- start:223 stop:501 length:279 start_codon:yes stop_codon:yes gene_type:complete